MYCFRIMSSHIKWVHATSAEGVADTSGMYTMFQMTVKSLTQIYNLTTWCIFQNEGFFFIFSVFQAAYLHSHHCPRKSIDSFIWFKQQCLKMHFWIIECPEKKAVLTLSWRQNRLGLNYWRELFLSVCGCLPGMGAVCRDQRVSVFYKCLSWLSVGKFSGLWILMW